MSSECKPCKAWIERPRIEPYCDRRTHYGQIGCLKHSRPVALQAEHTGELERKPMQKRRRKA